jgi:hypothetical protein
VLGALREESIQNEGSVATKDHPRILKKKGKMVECCFYSQNHFVRDCSMRGSLDLLIEKEEDQITPTTK